MSLCNLQNPQTHSVVPCNVKGSVGSRLLALDPKPSTAAMGGVLAGSAAACR